MNQKERDELLYRLDERTERVDEAIERIDERIDENANDIDDLQLKVRRNSTALGGIGTGLTAVLVWVADKLARFM